MNLDHHSTAQEAGRFRTTRWSVVLLSAQSQAPGSKAALAELCRLYWFPLYAFVRRRGYSPVDTQDLVQRFFLHLLDHKALMEVDPRKGKFRCFFARLNQELPFKGGREEVARTVSDPAEIEAEIHSLCEALVASEGRLGP